MVETVPYGTFETTVQQIREISQEVDTTDLTEVQINVYQDIAEGRIMSATNTKSADWTTYKTDFLHLFNAAKGAVILICRGFILRHFGKTEQSDADYEEARSTIKDITHGLGRGESGTGTLPAKAVFFHI